MQMLEDEAARLTDLLCGKITKLVQQGRSREIMIEFEDGTRLFVDCKVGDIECSVTGGSSEADEQ
jgi:hypothetical protein